ncbi:MAG: hypothetical protein Q4G28_09455 [Neisseria sp.]|nr:hypothetical protein [Neisseria sp.]
MSTVENVSNETLSAIQAEVLAGIEEKISAVSINPNHVVLNNFLPPDVAADVLLAKPTMVSHSAALQAAYDEHNALGKTIMLFGNFNMTKLTGYRADFYGEDNQAVPGVAVLKRHGAQPCFMARMHDNTIDFTGAVFTIDKLFQDGMHIAGYRGNNRLSGGRWFTKRILEIDPDKKSATDWKGTLGSKGAGKDWLAPIDGSTGFSFKGKAGEGFNSTTYSSYDLAFARNNSIDTSAIPASANAGGYAGFSADKWHYCFDLGLLGWLYRQ